MHIMSLEFEEGKRMSNIPTPEQLKELDEAFEQMKTWTEEERNKVLQEILDHIMSLEFEEGK